MNNGNALPHMMVHNLCYYDIDNKEIDIVFCMKCQTEYNPVKRYPKYGCFLCGGVILFKTVRDYPKVI
jgi:DNA-directed RNA polymerase subunit RPC12/RpoP